VNDQSARNTGRLASTVAVVAIGSAVCLAVFFAMRGPFGTLNDIGNATTGLLSGALAWRLRSRIPGPAGGLVVGAAVVGAAVTVLGSVLVISGATGFFFAGLVSSVGFAGIGLWLVILDRRAAEATGWPARLRILGAIGGGLMAMGVAAVPGIVLGLDDAATAPAWVWISSVGWLGVYVVYPAWALWVGGIESGRSGEPITAGDGGPSTDREEARSLTGG
jgi:hypothetical protein